jgi:hypothetical protein
VKTLDSSSLVLKPFVKTAAAYWWRDDWRATVNQTPTNERGLQSPGFKAGP